ncbi:MAG: HindVP family restriction endonuclease [Thiotrichaceae bacterium]|nr:HindVP family restriction endonuclease [Thiotrichaceae bacterium]
MSISALFGLKNSNRDFTQRESWGKNQFNSSFPTALACYMHSKDLNPVYLELNNELKVAHSKINVADLFGMNPSSEELFFSFESDYVPYRQLVIGNLPRIDLVTQNLHTHQCLQGLEIKLTALPDHTTCELTEDKFGSELVIRPDSIVYLALSIVNVYKNHIAILGNMIDSQFDHVKDWSEGGNVLALVPEIINTINMILLNKLDQQTPLIIQPVWKTLGKSPQLAQNCLDIFVWSNFAFTRLFLDIGIQEIARENKITRQLRSIIWLLKMLLDFCRHGKIDHAKVIDSLSYNTKNDKAFAVNGKITHAYMSCAELSNPRITQDEIKNIILGEGHLLLSPERRFDAIIYNSPYLFK